MDYANTVSKYFKHPYFFVNEKKSLNILKTILSPELYEELSKYAILPTDECVVDCSKIGKSPYDDTYEFNPRLCEPDETNVIMYPKGGISFHQYIRIPKNNATFAHYLENLKLVANVGKGIQLLQNNNLIHSDIKSLNMVLKDETLKLIDMADIKQISSISDDDFEIIPLAFMYYIYPPIAPWLGYYNELLDEVDIPF